MIDGSTRLHTKLVWSSQSTSEIKLSSRRTSPRGIDWMPSTWKYRACDYCLSNSSLLAVWLRLLCFCAIAWCMCQTLPLISRGNLAAFQASHSPSATWMFHGHVSVAEALALFLVMVVSVGSGLFVGPGPTPLLRTYSESGSRELGVIRSVLIRWSAEQRSRKIIREIWENSQNKTWRWHMQRSARQNIRLKCVRWV